MFADMDPVIPDWAKFVADLGATAILAAYFLYVKPREDKENRLSSEKIAASHERVVDKIQDRTVLAIEDGFERQTSILGPKLDSVRDAACKWRGA